jgi:hypothetical protein
MHPQVCLLVPLGELGAGIPGYPSQGLPGQPGYPSHQPVPGHPGHPDQGLPGGQPKPSQPIALPPNQPWPPGVNPPIVPPNPPPGTIWPPIPDGFPTHKALVLVYISGYGERHIVVDVPQPK